MALPDFFEPPAVHEWVGVRELHPMPGQEAALSALRNHVYVNSDIGCAFVLSGPPGTGKTKLAAAVWQALVDEDNKRPPPPFIRWSAFLRHLRGDKTWWKAPEFVQACRAWIALADDLPAPADDFEAEAFRVLVQERYDRHGAGRLSLTSNLSAKLVRTQYGERTADRLRDGTLWLVLDGDSLRRPLTTAELAKTRADIEADAADDERAA